MIDRFVYIYLYLNDNKNGTDKWIIGRKEVVKIYLLDVYLVLMMEFWVFYVLFYIILW